MPLFSSHQSAVFLCPIQMRESPSSCLTKVKTCFAALEARWGTLLNLVHVLLSLKLPPYPAFTFSYSLSSPNTLLLSKLGTCMGLHSSRFVLLDQGGVSASAVFLYPPIHHPPSCPPSLPPPFSPHCQLTSIPLVFIFPSLDLPSSHRPRIQLGLKGRLLYPTSSLVPE